MKVRNGFVSNSSSSSFIVATKKDKMEFTISIEANWGDLGTAIKTESALKSYFKANWGVDVLEEELLDWYTSALEAIREGYVIYAGEFDSDADTTAEIFLCENGIPKPLADEYKIIYNEAGY